MADMVLHRTLAEDVMDRLGMPLDKGLLLVGAQGPDPLYFNVLSRSSVLSRELADGLHEKNVDEAIRTMVLYAGRSDDIGLVSYVIGYLTHVALDRAIHPYIYHHSGNFDPKKPKFGHHRGLHLRFERRVDLEWIKRQTGKNPRFYPLLRLVLPREHIPDTLTGMMESVFRDVYGIPDAGHLFKGGYRRMRAVTRLVSSDRFGVKRVLYRFLDMFNRRHELFLSDFSFASPHEDADYLNLSRHNWRHPVTGEVSDASVDDLYKEALDDALSMIGAASPCLLEGRCDASALSFSDRSLNTGLSEHDPREMTIFSIYTESPLMRTKDEKQT
jgi:hypothetical protein